MKVHICDNAGCEVICMYFSAKWKQPQAGWHTLYQAKTFEEALHDTTGGLTYHALSGIQKQNMEDVERLFGLSLIMWMESKGYDDEATYVSQSYL